VRDFWRGEPASLGEFAARFTGSSDLYEADNRRPIASINFVTAHDGFTLNDLVSYNENEPPRTSRTGNPLRSFQSESEEVCARSGENSRPSSRKKP
jgi:isoamylase